MYKVLTLITAGVLFILATSTNAQPAEKRAAFVWLFYDIANPGSDLSRRVTREYEEALVNSDVYRVVTRRDLASRMEVLENEEAIGRALDIPTGAEDALEEFKTDLVIFGEIDDDIESGEIVITVSIERLGGHKERLTSISMPRGKVNDRDSRREAIAELISKLEQRTRPRTRIRRHGFVFEIQETRREGKSIFIDLEITSLDDDKYLTLYANTSNSESLHSQIHDDASIEHLAANAILAKKSFRRNITTLLIADTPAKAQFEFTGVSSKVVSIPRFDIRAHSEELDRSFEITFRNLEIKSESE